LTNSECLFCQFSNNEISTDKIFENEHCFVIRDIEPQAPIHLLVISKKHIPRLSEMNSTNILLISHMASQASEAAEKFGITSSGYRILINNGPDAGMTIAHLHMHILGGKKLGAGG
tara:strand:- start:477 stop:824 length:348 start_codon:yes stop_codon:yes gene_type:complete